MKKKKDQYYLTDRNPKAQFFLSFILHIFCIGSAIPAFIAGAPFYSLIMVGLCVYFFFEYTLPNYKIWRRNKKEK